MIETLDKYDLSIETKRIIYNLNKNSVAAAGVEQENTETNIRNAVLRGYTL